MLRNYVVWALVGMIGYSFTTLFVKLAVRGGHLSSYAVLAIATTMVATTSVLIVAMRGEMNWHGGPFDAMSFFWACATGISLTIAVSSLFRALALGPATVVIPVYGMFIVGGAALSIIFLNEPLTLRKAVGFAAAILGVYLVSSGAPR